VLLDPRLKVPLRAQLYRNARDVPVWLVVGDRATGASVAEREALGVEPVRVSEDDTGLVPMAEVLAALAGRGITRLLVEGGSRLAAALLGAGLVDRLAWFRAPLVLGGDGLGAADALGLARLADAPRFRRVDVERVGDDILETYAREGQSSVSPI
jgi:diaminohydroxyphosphoribosylaminopyrimidine deaminase/5-amino-6-(5-phosphoribosylamino)uracil reductase